jgi:hypothetical protein
MKGKDTQTIPILQANADGTLTASMKTVTRRRPDLLYTLDHLSGEKVPKYVSISFSFRLQNDVMMFILTYMYTFISPYFPVHPLRGY